MKLEHTLCLRTLALLCVATSASAQTTLREWSGASDGLGASLANVGDVDRDGVDDLALGAPGDDTFAIDAGAVVVVSGSSGKEITKFLGRLAAERFGTDVRAFGDVDGDGLPELIVTSMIPTTTNRQIRCIAFVNGAVLWERRSHYNSDGFATIVAPLGDANYDGVPDVAVSIPYYGATSAGYAQGLVRVFSGCDGGFVHETIGALVTGVYGNALSAAGDLDGDGAGDYWASEIEFAAGIYSSKNRVRGRSGLDGRVIQEARTPQWNYENQGARIVGGHDLDLDLVPDVIVSSVTMQIQDYHGPGHVYAFSGANGRMLWSRAGADTHARLGTYLFDVGDVDGDGIADVAASIGFTFSITYQFLSGATGAFVSTPLAQTYGTRIQALCPASDVDEDGRADVAWGVAIQQGGYPLVNYGAGSVRVLTLASTPLRGDHFDVSGAAGGTQTLSLAFGPAFAGRAYRVLGSLSGAHGGLSTFAGELPLTMDAYFWSTLRGADHYLGGASGVLDAEGRATASVSVPPNSFRLPAGTALRHAAVVLNDTGSGPAAVSRAVPLLVR